MVTILRREIDNYWDIPIVGPWPLKIGKIARLWATPCSPSPEIWVYAFWHDIPWLVWSIVKPEPIDLAWDRFGGKHHTKRKRRFHIIDKNGPRIPVPKGKASWAAFTVGNAAQRVGWYLLVVDATLEFAINWQSTAYMWEGCGVEDARWARGRAISAVDIFGSGVTGPIGIWRERSDHGFSASIASMQSPPGFDVQCTTTLVYEQLQGNVVSAQLIDTENNEVFDVSQPTQQPDGKWQVSFGTRDWSISKPAHNFGIFLECSETTHLNCAGSTIELYGNKRKGLKWDP